MEDKIKENVIAIGDLLYAKKAQEIISINIMDKSIIADYMIMCSGRSTIQVKALCDDVEEMCKGRGLELRRTEGYNLGRWIVMDYADILVHIFHPEERQYYDVERLWKEDNNFEDISAQKDEAFAQSK